MRRQTVMWIGLVITTAMFISRIVFGGARSSALVSIQDPFLREMGRAMVNVLTHGLMVQTIFFMIVGIGLIIGAWQAAPDSVLRQWEASKKVKVEAESTPETTGIQQMFPGHFGEVYILDQITMEKEKQS